MIADVCNEKLKQELDDLISNSIDNDWVVYEQCKIILNTYHLTQSEHLEFIKYIVEEIGL